MILIKIDEQAAAAIPGGVREKRARRRIRALKKQ